jgi:voltage-gated sodium channel
MPNPDPETKSVYESLDNFALYIYSIELGLRIISYGFKPWKFFSQRWNIFDFFIVALSPLFAGQVVILRLLRLFRLIRIFRFLPEVKVLTSSVARSLPPLLSMGVLIFLALFIYGMAGVYLFGEQIPLHWGNISIALTTLFILLTLENFPSYLEEATLVSAWALPFFLSYIFIIVFTVLNVLIGVVLNAMDEARADNKKRIDKLKQLDQIIQEVELITADGKITSVEITQLKKKLAILEKLASEKQQN